jgi:hypothetical protein
MFMFERALLMNSDGEGCVRGEGWSGVHTVGRLGAVNNTIELAWWTGPIDTRFVSGRESRPVHMQAVVEGCIQLLTIALRGWYGRWSRAF